MKKIIFITAAFSLTVAAHAANMHWNVSSGDWAVGSNWLGGVAPGAGDIAYIQNNGTVQVSTDVTVSRFFPGWSASTSGTVKIGSGGSLTATDTINLGQSGNGTIYVNGGTLNALGGTPFDGLTSSGSGTIKMDSGKITSSGGTWNFARGGSMAWDLTGGMFAVGGQINTPLIDDTLTFGGTTFINPGDRGTASGLIFRNGSALALSDNSTLEIDILGSTRAWNHDTADAYDYFRQTDDSITLDGDLNIYIGDGFTPMESDSFEIVFAGDGISGAFDNALNDGDRFNTADGKGSFEIDYRANQVYLTNFAPIPEPATLGLLSAVGGISLFIRRRFMT